MTWFSKIFLAKPTRQGIDDPVRDSIRSVDGSAASGSESSRLRDGSMHEQLQTVISRASSAAYTQVLDRMINLPDDDLMVLVNALQTCGKLADESGHLLPLPLFSIARSTLIADGESVRYKSILAVLDIPEIDGCIHGRSIRADVLAQIVRLISSGGWEQVQDVRHRAEQETDTSVYRELIRQCDALRARVKTAVRPRPGDPWWRQYYEPIGTFRAFAEKAIKQARKRGR